MDIRAIFVCLHELGSMCYLSSCPVLHLQFEWSMKTLDVSESREIHLVLVQLELHNTEKITITHSVVQCEPGYSSACQIKHGILLCNLQ